MLTLLKSLAPTEHHAALDAAFAGTDTATVNGVTGILQALVALLQKIGASVNWPCLIGVIPQAIAAFANPALWAAVIAAYFACANPPIPKP